MKINKTFALVAVVGTLVVAGCNTSDGSEDSGSISRPPVTTVDDTEEETAALCLEAVGTIEEGLAAVAEGAAYLPYVSAAEVQEFLDSSSEFVEESMETVELCSYLSPDDAEELLEGLQELDAAIDEYGSLY